MSKSKDEEQIFNIENPEPVQVRKRGESNYILVPPIFVRKLKQAFVELLSCSLEIKNGKIRIVYEEIEKPKEVNGN